MFTPNVYRQFRRARRDGPLRYIIPHSDDQPPPYGNYGPPTNAPIRPSTDTTNEEDIIAGDRIDEADGGLSNHTRNPMTMASHVQSVLGGSRKTAETPPPTYDEALAISQGIILNDSTSSVE